MSARAALATTVLVAWGTGIALFVHRERSRSPMERLAEVALRVVPGVNWYEVTRAGRPVGFASIGVDTVPRELEVTDYMVWEDSQEPSPRRASAQTVVRLSRGLALHGIRVVRTSGADSARIDATAESDSIMRVHSGTDGTAAMWVRHDMPAFVPSIVPMVATLREAPRVGATSAFPIIDVDSGVARQLVLRIAAESLFTLADSAAYDAASARWLAAHRDTVRAWRFTGEGRDSSFDAWIDAQGQVVESRAPGGLRLRRTAYELAFENWRQESPEGGVTARAGGAVVASTWLAAGDAPPPALLDTLELRIRSVPGSVFTTMFGRRYRAGSSLLLTRPRAERLRAGYTLPGSDAWRRSLGPVLRAGPGIESDAPAIVALARRLRGDETDPGKVTKRLVAWMHDSIGRSTTSRGGGALDVLTRRRGDSDDFARLFVALARASGIPARPVAGLLLAGGHFYYHAWADVLLGGYVPVDPMFGELPAGAGHVRFGDVGPDLQVELMRVLARLELEVVRSVPDE